MTMIVVETRERQVSCDGDSKGKEKASGHPKIFLDLPNGGSVACPYCGQQFKNIG
jgi:uncharacterized Zn-finger protein